MKNLQKNYFTSTRGVTRLPQRKRVRKFPAWVIGSMLGALAFGLFTIASMPKHQVEPAKVVAPVEAPVVTELSYGYCDGCGTEGE